MPEVVLQTDGLTKRYGSLTAVNNLTLEIYAGEIFGFLGPNGAGKTTSINMMCGLLRPDSGQVRIHGKPVTNGDAATRTRVGMCPQDIIIWETLTCIEQLQFVGEMYGIPGRESRRRGEQLLSDMELTDKRNKLANTLSGGMKRRLNIALALIHDPELVVFDEPEAGLDPQSRIKVRDYIRSLARRKTVILTTHNMDEAERLADRVAIIDHGELLVLDTPAALKHSVGAGDVVEIRLNGEAANGQAALAALQHLADKARIDLADNTLTIRALDVVNLLPAILEALAAADIKPGNVGLRENTLEDVFIQLTGRRLRQ